MYDVPSPQVLKAMKRHIDNFVSHRLDEDVEENVSPDVHGVTPLSNFVGPTGLRSFYDVFRDYLPKASIWIKSVEYQPNKVIYHWQASGPTATVQNGKCTACFKDNKIIEQSIECEVEPCVQNQG